MNHKPSYYLNEIKEAEIEMHTFHGYHKYTATLVEFFGTFSIILASYSEAKKLEVKGHSWDEAEKEFDRFVQLHNLGKVVA